MEPVSPFKSFWPTDVIVCRDNAVQVAVDVNCNYYFDILV